MLTISDSNYLLAIQMLKQEFLDVDYIIDETYKNILKAAPSVDYYPEYTSSKMYLNEMRSYLHELKTHNIDLVQDRTAEHSLISHIVFNNLPVNLRRELIHRTSNNYSSLDEVFCHYNEAIKTLKMTIFLKKKTGNKQSSKQSTVTSNSSSNSSSNSFKSKNKGETKSNIQNFKSVNTKVNQLTCKLCSAEGYSMGKCNNFNNYENKISRLKESSLCIRCAGSGHDNSCYGKQSKLRFECKVCKKREHITPLCPTHTKSKSSQSTNVNLCFAQRSFDSSHILPTMTLDLKNGYKSREIICLIDTGSQRSYTSEKAAKDLCQDVSGLYALECDVCTCIGQDTRSFKQMSTGIRINNRLIFIPLLVDSTLNITFEVPGMNEIINKFRQNNIALLDETFNEDKDHEIVAVDMLIGTDIMLYMSSVTWNKVLGGACLVINNKMAPIGNVFNFLNKDHSKSVMSSINKSDDKNVSFRTKTMINLVMDPLKSYFNPLEHILEDCEVDNGLEHLFNLESMGIKKDDKELISFDED